MEVKKQFYSIGTILLSISAIYLVKKKRYIEIVMEKAKRGIKISTEIFECIFTELMDSFSSVYNVNVKALKVSQLYGFGTYNESIPNIRKFIFETTKQPINGKYLYNKRKQIETSATKSINITRDYLSILLKSIKYDSYSDYLARSGYITPEIKSKLETVVDNRIEYDDTLYYIGYYVEDKNYFIKSKLTIYQNKMVDWDIRYWETTDKPSYYSYSGKVVKNDETALSFYFPKENSNLSKECFINLFSGNNMRVKPILQGAYCGFERNSLPVVGKIIFERVSSEEEQEELVLSTEINPLIYQLLYSQRIAIPGVLPHDMSELMPAPNYFEIFEYLIGEYHGFFMNSSQMVPLTLNIINNLGSVQFTFQNKKYLGIGRLSSHENFLNIEFENESDNLHCNCTLKVKPIAEGVFEAFILINIGSFIYSGKSILWKNNSVISKLIELNPAFDIKIDDLPKEIANQIKELSPEESIEKNILNNKNYTVPLSFYGKYKITLDNQATWSLKLSDGFLIENDNGVISGKAYYINGSICLLQNAINDIEVLGLTIIFVGNISRKHILEKEGIYLSINDQLIPHTERIVFNVA